MGPLPLEAPEWKATNFSQKPTAFNLFLASQQKIDLVGPAPANDERADLGTNIARAAEAFHNLPPVARKFWEDRAREVNGEPKTGLEAEEPPSPAEIERRR